MGIVGQVAQCRPSTSGMHPLPAMSYQVLDLRRSRVVGHDTGWRAHVVHRISRVPRVHLIPSVHSVTTELRGEYLHIYYLSNTPLTHCT